MQTKAEALLPQRKRYRFLIGACCTLLLSVSALAQDVSEQLRLHITQELQQYLQQTGVASTKQDIQLNVPAAIADSHCQQLDISRRQQQTPPLGRVSYTLSCTAPQRWQSRAVAQIRLYLPLVVASRTLQRDEVLSQDMLQIQELDISSLRHDPQFDLNALLGLTVKRRISAGSPLHRHLLQADYLVHKGAQVTVQVIGAGFAVATVATALANGQLGETIRVKNLTSGKEFDAIVTAENTVETGYK